MLFERGVFGWVPPAAPLIDCESPHRSAASGPHSVTAAGDRLSHSLGPARSGRQTDLELNAYDYLPGAPSPVYQGWFLILVTDGSLARRHTAGNKRQLGGKRRYRRLLLFILWLCCKDDRRRWEAGDKLDPILYAAVSKRAVMKIACPRISRPPNFRICPFRIIAIASKPANVLRAVRNPPKPSPGRTRRFMRR
jgi:hypothetical protein